MDRVVASCSEMAKNSVAASERNTMSLFVGQGVAPNPQISRGLGLRAVRTFEPCTISLRSLCSREGIRVRAAALMVSIGVTCAGPESARYSLSWAAGWHCVSMETADIAMTALSVNVRRINTASYS